MHGRKSVLSIGMARGELTRGEVTRFHCITEEDLIMFYLSK